MLSSPIPDGPMMSLIIWLYLITNATRIVTCAADRRGVALHRRRILRVAAHMGLMGVVACVGFVLWRAGGA